jgi:hypothetical protein
MYIELPTCIYLDNNNNVYVGVKTKAKAREENNVYVGVKTRSKAREERARFEKAQKSSQKTRCHNLESVESSSNSSSFEY